MDDRITASFAVVFTLWEVGIGPSYKCATAIVYGHLTDGAFCGAKKTSLVVYLTWHIYNFTELSVVHTSSGFWLFSVPVHRTTTVMATFILIMCAGLGGLSKSV